MTDTGDHVVIPYSEFLAAWLRRRPLAELRKPVPPTAGADGTPAPAPDEPRTRITTTWRTP